MAEGQKRKKGMREKKINRTRVKEIIKEKMQKKRERKLKSDRQEGKEGREEKRRGRERS